MLPYKSNDMHVSSLCEKKISVIYFSPEIVVFIIAFDQVCLKEIINYPRSSKLTFNFPANGSKISLHLFVKFLYFIYFFNTSFVL